MKIIKITLAFLLKVCYPMLHNLTTKGEILL